MTCLLPLESPVRKQHSWCQQVCSWHSSEAKELNGVLDYPPMLWLYTWTSEEDSDCVGCLYHQLYILGLEVCKAASSPSGDPRGNILLLSPLLPPTWTQFDGSELQILAVTQIQCSASKYLQPQSFLRCCQCINWVSWNLNLYLVQTEVHDALASSCLLYVSTAFTYYLETVSTWVLSEITWLCSALMWHLSSSLGKVMWANTSKLALPG